MTTDTQPHCGQYGHIGRAEQFGSHPHASTFIGWDIVRSLNAVQFNFSPSL
ncbi:hypothetical protein F7725_001638, partial [Dissostichus mawsoni]